MTRTPSTRSTKQKRRDEAAHAPRRPRGAGRTRKAEGSSAPPGDAIRHFKTSEVVDLLGLSRRQLQYWSMTGLVEPSSRTPGGHHRYDFSDLVALKATKRLIDAGVSVQKIRSSVGALRALLPQVGRPLSELVLVATGDVVLVFHDETVFEAITGQEWVFPVAAFEREVSDFLRQEAGALRQEAGALRQEAGALRQETGALRRETGALRREAGAASQPEVGPDAGESREDGSGRGERGARLSKPGVRSARQTRKRWSRTG